MPKRQHSISKQSVYAVSASRSPPITSNVPGQLGMDCEGRCGKESSSPTIVTRNATRVWRSRPAVCSQPSVLVLVLMLVPVEGVIAGEQAGRPKVRADMFKQFTQAPWLEKKRATRHIVFGAGGSCSKAFCDHFCAASQVQERCGITYAKNCLRRTKKVRCALELFQV